MAARKPSKKPAKSALMTGLKVPKIDERTLGNGLRVLAAPRGPLPLVAMRLVIRAGSAFDPPDKFGLADFTTRLLRRGVEGMSADQLNEAVEFVGANLGIGVGEDFVSLRISAPAEHAPAMLEILAKLARSPVFAEDEVASARTRTLAQLANDLDEPSLLADRALTRALWGEHPYAHDVSGRAAHVQGFTREDVVRHHRERLGPRVAMLLGVGALDPETFHADAERAFGSWSGGPEAATVLPRAERSAFEGRVVLVDKPDQTQTQVRIGSLSIPRNHPDYMAAQVTSMLLGGGFTSRLMEQIRVNRGLSYGVSCAIDTMQAGGWFGISTFTKNETTRQIIDVALAEVARLQKKGVKPDELAQTQRYMAGLYPMRLETNEAIAGSIADMKLFEMPADWIERFRERIHAVSPKEPPQMATRHFLNPAPTVAVLGKASEIRKQLEGLGPIEIWKPADLG